MCGIGKNVIFAKLMCVLCVAREREKKRLVCVLSCSVGHIVLLLSFFLSIFTLE